MEEQTNYLSPQMFKDFIGAIPKLDVYHNNESHAALPAYEMQLLFKVLYYCALRISEVLNLGKDDFNLERRILRVKRAKTGNNQKTSIPKPLLDEMLHAHVSLSDTPFGITRQTAWDYAKKAARLAGLNLFESQNKRDIEGAWTHLFRKSYAKWMQEEGADISLIKVKLRHTGSEIGSTFTYIKPDINALIKWESDHHG